MIYSISGISVLLIFVDHLENVKGRMDRQSPSVIFSDSQPERLPAHTVFMCILGMSAAQPA